MFLPNLLVNLGVQTVIRKLYISC